MDNGLDFRLLGPLEVLLHGKLIDIGAARQQIVLAMLLLGANRTVSVSRLIEALWDDDPPSTAKGQVQICVSALRRQLTVAGGCPAIVTRPAGYLISAPDDALDVRRFEALAANGAAAAAEHRPEEAVQLLRAGLSLWRGLAATGVDSRVVQVSATRLNESRVAAMENCLELELQLGRHHDVIGELRELVAEYPLRERLHGHLMLALYRSGRQAEALESFRLARVVLMEELGLDPSEQLRSLEQAILVNDRSLGLPETIRAGVAHGGFGGVPVPRQLPGATADFAGRQDVLDRVLAMLSAAPDDRVGKQHVPVVALTGKGGVGKTALAVRIAHLLRDQYPDGQLFASLHDGNGQPKSPAGQLELFTRSFGISPAVLPNGLEDLTGMYRSWLAERRILIVLDDAAGLGQVVPLLPGSPTCAVIITSRHRLSGLHCSHFEIDALDEGSSLELLASVIGADRIRAEADAARALVGLCEHLPLALRIVAAKIAARPHWRVSQMVRRLADDKRRLDELDLEGVSVRATISLSCESLDEDTRRLFLRISLLGASDFASWIGAPLLDTEIGVAEELLDNLVDARLVDARVRDDGSVRFQLHDLVRIYAAERLMEEEPAATRAAALGRLLGCWLSLAGEAHRRECGGDFSVLHGNAPQWRLPAETVDTLLEDPIGWFQHEHAALVSAIFRASRAGLDELCWDLAVTSVTLFESGSFVDDWRRTHGAALEIVRRAGNQRGEAALLCSLGTLALTERLSEAASCLDRAQELFSELGDVHGLALSLGGLAFADRLSGRYGAALRRYQEALAGFEQVGDFVSQAHVLKDMAQIHMDQQRYEIAQQLLDEAMTVCQKLGGHRVTAQTEYQLAELYLRRSQLELAEQSFELTRLTASAGGDLVGQAYALLGLGITHSTRGDYVLAERDLQAAGASAERTGNPLIRGRVLLALAELDCARQQTADAMTRVEEALGVLDGLGPAGVWPARLLELKGRLHEQAGDPDAAALAWTDALECAREADTALSGRLAIALAALGARTLAAGT
jgi:DNA-binding SARP family transcriptional activator